MKPEEFAKMIKEVFPDQITLLKNSIAKLKEGNLSDEETQFYLDIICKISGPPQQSKWLADMHGFDILLPYLKDKNDETRRGAAMIIALANQNNVHVLKVFNKSPGMKAALDSLQGEEEFVAGKQKFTMISCLLRCCKANREDFYKADGFKTLIAYCEKWPKIWSSFAFTLSSIIDEEEEIDVAEMKKAGIKDILLAHKDSINSDTLNDILAVL